LIVDHSNGKYSGYECRHYPPSIRTLDQEIESNQEENYGQERELVEILVFENFPRVKSKKIIVWIQGSKNIGLKLILKNVGFVVIKAGEIPIGDKRNLFV